MLAKNPAALEREITTLRARVKRLKRQAEQFEATCCDLRMQAKSREQRMAQQRERDAIAREGI